MRIRGGLWVCGLMLAALTGVGTPADGQGLARRVETLTTQTRQIKDHAARRIEAGAPGGQRQAASPAGINMHHGTLHHSDSESGETISGAPPLPLSILPVRQVPHIREVYADALSILSESNTCSQFFGGSVSSIEVLNELVKRLKITFLDDRRIGIRMTGPVEERVVAQTHLPYRLFERTEVNGNGPFNKGRMFHGESSIPKVGNFPPNTREARVLILLHELGHLMKGADGHWLLPNDGYDEKQSEKNTALVLSRCKDQIKELQ